MNSSMYLVLIDTCYFNERQHDSTEFNRLVRKLRIVRKTYFLLVE